MQRGRIFSRVPVHGRALAGRAEAGDILLSTQVLQEFYVAVTRKLARDRHVEFLQHLRAQQNVTRFGAPRKRPTVYGYPRENSTPLHSPLCILTWVAVVWGSSPGRHRLAASRLSRSPRRRRSSTRTPCGISVRARGRARAGRRNMRRRPP